MSIHTTKVSVTAVSHGNTGVITAFFNELPGLLVQGDSEDDIKRKLRVLLDKYIQRLQAAGSNFDITTKNIA